MLHIHSIIRCSGIGKIMTKVKKISSYQGFKDKKHEQTAQKIFGAYLEVEQICLKSQDDQAQGIKCDMKSQG